METIPQFTVSQFIDVANQTLEYAFGSILIEGEVASFKVNQNKYIFFDLKDESASVSCFMMAYQLRLPVEDGMKVAVRAVPKITKWGKFSLTIQTITPQGEGSLKKSYQLLKNKLEKDGLFAPERKRSLPTIPNKIGVISSTQAAGYVDFMKILNDRWGGVEVQVAHVQVQGDVAADQMINAIEYFNQLEELPDLLALIRGGGSAADLASFNDEKLVRTVAASRVPIITGIGHEVDESLVDLVADVRAATPSNAAQLVVPDKQYFIKQIHSQLGYALNKIDIEITNTKHILEGKTASALAKIETEIAQAFRQQNNYLQLINSFNPRNVLARGYAVLRGDIKVGQEIEIETSKQLIKAEVKNVTKK